MIKLEKITVQIANKILLENASAQIPDGEKLGIVGHNGCGKTTLFKVLKEELEVSQGEVFIPSKQFKAFVEQEIEEEDLHKSILNYVLDKDKRLKTLKENEKTATPSDLSEIYEQLHLIEADSAEARTAEILKGLGFNNEDLTRPVKDFSGGWQMRLNLAGALFQYSDILFLDEPTNHLDIEAVVWLENYLKKYRGTILLISHDKDFLNEICQSILHFEGQKLALYRGNYDSFSQQYAQKTELAEKAKKKQEDRRAHLQSYVDRFRYKASKAKQAQSRLKMLEKMQDIPEVARDKASRFIFSDLKPLPSPLITVENASTGYNGVPVLKKLNFCINQDDRIALLGKNGNGKSTLVKMLAGRLPVYEGIIKKSSKLNIGYFNQNQAEELQENLSPTEYIQAFMPDKPEKTVRAYLGNFGLEQEKAVTKIGLLSGGEKTRLLFAKINLNAPEILIFDEPTNHLDMTGRTALADAINAYAGAVILISHDFNLLSQVADSLWLVNNHTVTAFTGDLEEYRRFLLEKEASKLSVPQTPRTIKKPLKNNKDDRVARAKLRKIKHELEMLEAKKNELFAQFTDASGKDIVTLNKTLRDIEQKIAQKEEDWLSLSENIN